MDPSFCGVSKGDIGLCISHIPGRVKPCLVVREGNHETVVASFTGIVGEEKFKRVLWELIHEYTRQ